MKNDSQFVVRLPKEQLDRFNETVKDNAANRAELLRKWIKEYIKENKGDEKIRRKFKASNKN